MREGLSYNEVKGFRSAHNRLTDEEFEELASDDTDEPMTREQLQEIAQEKRALALALEPENEASRGILNSSLMRRTDWRGAARGWARTWLRKSSPG